MTTTLQTAMFGIATSLVVGTTPPFLLETIRAEGLRIEWQIDKVAGPTPDTGTIRIFNLHPAQRKAIATAKRVSNVPLFAVLQIGWNKRVEILFEGYAHRTAPEIRRDVDIVTELELGAGKDTGLRDTPPGGGVDVGKAIEIVIVERAVRAGLSVSEATRALINSRAAAVPLTSFSSVVDATEVDEQLDLMLAALGLNWGRDGDFLVVYDNGLRNDLAPTVLTPNAGLLAWNELDDGGVEFEALAQPRVVPGIQLQVVNEFGVLVGGGPLRCESVSFTGTSDTSSLMRGVARKVLVT